MSKKHKARAKFESLIFNLIHKLFPVIPKKIIWRLSRDIRKFYSYFYSKRDGKSPWIAKCIIPNQDNSKELWWVEHNSPFWITNVVFEKITKIVNSCL